MITFRAEGKDGTVLTNARIFVGHYEARVSPIADTNPATTGPNLDDVADFAPGTYELVAQAPGYGHLRGEQTFQRARARLIEFRFPTNYASAAKRRYGGRRRHGRRPARNLIDDTENTQLDRRGHDHRRRNLSVDGKQVTVDLAGTDPVGSGTSR